MAETPAWKVLGDQITQSTTLKRGGTGITDIYEVPYQVTSGPAAGHTGTVTIDAAAFNPASVQAAIAAQVGAVHDVAQLSS